MRTWAIFYRAGSRFCLRCALSFLIWALWSGLALLLLVQVWIACAHELIIPLPLLRMVEHHLSQSGVTVKLVKVILDPSGQLVVRDFTIVLDSFKEPIVRGSLLHTRIDPWGMLTGDPNAHHLELSGLEILLPAPVSPSGRTEAYVKDLGAVFFFQNRELQIANLTALLGDIVISAHGSVQWDAWRRAHSGTENLTLEAALGQLVEGMRRFASVYPKLNVIQGARVSLELSPSESRGAIAEVLITAEALRLPAPYECVTGPLLLSGRFPITGESPVMTRLHASLEDLTCAGVTVKTLQANLRGMLHPTTFSFDPREAELAAASVEGQGLIIKAPSLRVESGPLPVLHIALAAGVADTVVDASGTVDTDTRSGKLRIATSPTDGLLDIISSKIGRDLKRYVRFTGQTQLEGDASFTPGGKLQLARGWIEADDFSIQGVQLDHIKGNLLWDGRQFHGTQAVMRQRNNIARGSYWMDTATRDYRFLLTGRMQPTDISDWFTEWWPALWSKFVFPEPVPDADVDITGRWYAPSLSKVFVGADASKVTVSSVSFEKANTQLYILPNFLHALALHAVRPEGEATGWFVRTYNPQADAWRTIDFDVHSTVNIQEGARIFAPMGPELVADYFFANSPTVHGRGHLDGPGAPEGLRHSVEIDIASKGEFQLQGFPLENLNCFVRWNDQHIEINRINAHFAQGTVEGKIAINQREKDQRITFDGFLKDARLADAVRITDAYFTKKNGGQVQPKPAAPPDKALDSRLDLSLNAEGRYGDPLSMQGAGQAQLSGELGQVRLFGLLSQLLRFTTLRFTTATTQFTLEGKQIVFPSLRIRGKNSAIEGRGRYSLENRTLDFNAKVWPFEESRNLIQGVIGLVLAPFSNALEVKLEGTLSNPSWSFANNPFRTRGNPDEPAQGNPVQQNTPPAPPIKDPQSQEAAEQSSAKSQDKD